MFAALNRESGQGSYDIQLQPLKKSFPGIRVELKRGKNYTDAQLKKLSENALSQICDRKYDTELIREGITTVYRYDIAYSGKNAEISVD